MYCVGDFHVQPFVRTLGVVEFGVARYAHIQLPTVLIVVQINIFVLQTPPEAFDENVVKTPASSIHTNLDATSG